MAGKRWRLVVTELGRTSSLHEVTVEADNWVGALQRGRAEIGERGGVPTGASCAVEQDGRVTILDPMARRAYIVTPQEQRADVGESRAGQIGQAGQAGQAAARRASVRVSEPASELWYASTARAARTAAAEPAGRRSEPALIDALELLHQRDEDPTDAVPLLYRERAFVLGKQTAAEDAERLLRERFEAIRLDLDSYAAGKLVHLAVFDHRWNGRPLRPPLVTLKWKDWHGAPEIARHGQRSAAVQQVPEATAPRASLSAGGSAPHRRPTPSGEHDERLAHAFDALQELLVLATPAEALDFIVKLLGALVPSEASSACLYDINTDEFRFVALSGPGASERRSMSVPRAAGLFGAAAGDIGTALLLVDVVGDKRFDPGVDGRLGLEVRNAAYMPLAYEGRLLGMLQLVNRQSTRGFSTADVDLLAYVAKGLSEFLYNARLLTQHKKR